MLNANMCFSMRNYHATNYKVDSHTHDCYEIVYYLTGNGKSKIGDKTFTYHENCYCIIPPNTPHSEFGSGVVELMYIGFEYDNNLGRLGSIMSSDKSGEICDLMQSIQTELKMQDSFYEDFMTIKMMELILLLLRTFCKKSSNTTIYLNYAINYINENYMKNICLEELSKNTGYSYHRFRHKFKEVYGISPKQYIINTRLTHAKLLLSQENVPVNSIARLCGFNNTSHFVTTFKQSIGISPTVYRESANNHDERANY